jgi:hypothetical protein
MKTQLEKLDATQHNIFKIISMLTTLKKINVQRDHMNFRYMQ